MRKLMEVTFGSGKLPKGWTEEQRECRFERGALRSGRVALLRFRVPGKGWGVLRVELEVEPIGGAALVFSNHTINARVDLARGRHDITHYGGARLAEGQREAPKKKGRYVVAFEVNAGCWKACVDGRELIAATDPRPVPTGGLVELAVWDDCLVHRVRVMGDREVRQPVFAYPAKRSPSFFLEVNVDFYDDVMHAPFTNSMFDQLFEEFGRWGVRRCHWIYYGGTRNGWWGGDPLGAAENVAKTVQNIGGEVFDEAVRAAHAHDIQIYGMMKPFDMGLWVSAGEGTPEAKAKGKVPRIGGPVTWMADFVAKNRQWIMSRKPGAWGDARNKIFTRIDLVKADAGPAAFKSQEVRLFVSDDNATYRPYEGPVEREEVIEDYPVWEHTSSGGRPTGQSRRSRVMRFKRLQISNQYVILAVGGRSGSFANTLVNLVHVFGEQGEERRVTYGVKVREVGQTPEGAATRKAFDRKDPRADFEKYGLEYDCWPGVPTAVFPGFDGIRASCALDGGEGVLGIARGKDPGTVATLSPFFPEVRAWWRSWIQDCLEAGADGIELRYRHHHSPLAWAEFGFEQPVRDEFLKRYGVDIWKTDDFDRAAWRRLRGEAYTQFYREARVLTKRHGKPLGIHIEPGQCMEPEQGACMEMHLDWRTWIEEGLADSVTMKELWPRTRFAEEVLSHTRRKGIEAIFCPYANGLWQQPGGEKVVADWIRLARENDYDGYQFYENAAVVRATQDGRIVMEQPALREIFRRESAKRI